MSPQPEERKTRFIEINAFTSEEDKYTLTYFYPVNETEYRSCSNFTAVSTPFSLETFDSPHPTCGTGSYSAKNIARDIAQYSCPIEIVALGLESSVKHEIQSRLDHKGVSYTWYEDMNNLDARRIHDSCVKIQIDIIKMIAQVKIRELLGEFEKE